MPTIIGVQYRPSGKIYYYQAPDKELAIGSHVIVESSRGLEYATVRLGPKELAEEDLAAPLKKIIRSATEEDDRIHAENLRKADDAHALCLEKIKKHGLDMKLTGVEYTFDNSKIIFYFTADGRVDFRALVKDLASVFHTRIELRQIGVRDEAKRIGGIGICGYPLCCRRFIREFSRVSIKMAKNQRLSLNPSNISGSCGRLLCCLNYENDLYLERQKEEQEARRQASRKREAEETQKASERSNETTILIEEATSAEDTKNKNQRSSNSKQNRQPRKDHKGRRRQGKRPKNRKD